MSKIGWVGVLYYRELAGEELENYARLYVNTVQAGYSAQAEFELLTKIRDFAVQIMNGYYYQKEE